MPERESTDYIVPEKLDRKALAALLLEGGAVTHPHMWNGRTDDEVRLSLGYLNVGYISHDGGVCYNSDVQRAMSQALLATHKEAFVRMDVAGLFDTLGEGNHEV